MGTLSNFLYREVEHTMTLKRRYQKFSREQERILEENRKTTHYKRIFKENLSNVSYPLPVFLISFPRSGSNFLQSVVQQSSLLLCKSFYAYSEQDMGQVLMYKSHSISWNYFEDEIIRTLNKSYLPTKLILLYRDPRDIMISFYEYTQFKKEKSIPQDRFLDYYDFFLASPIDKYNNRKSVDWPISIIDAYRLWYKSWFDVNLSLNPVNVLKVKYENLVLQPETTFSKIFEFLELNCSLDKTALRKKVSLYSTNQELRATPYGWKEKMANYRHIMDTIHSRLGHELASLGYIENT